MGPADRADGGAGRAAAKGPEPEPEDDERPRCPECGAPREPDAEVCPECGTELGGADEAASAAASAPQ